MHVIIIYLEHLREHLPKEEIIFTDDLCIKEKEYSNSKEGVICKMHNSLQTNIAKCKSLISNLVDDNPVCRACDGDLCPSVGVQTRAHLCRPFSCTQPTAVKRFSSFVQEDTRMASRRLLRQLFDKESSTYTYLLADMVAREAILIDPVIEQV